MLPHGFKHSILASAALSAIAFWGSNAKAQATRSDTVAAIPATVQWSGVLNSLTLANALVTLSLTNTDGKLSGTAMTRTIFQEGAQQLPVKGSVKGNRCTISFGGQSFKGECSATGFNGANSFLGDTDSLLAVWSDGAARLARSAARFPANLTFTGVSKAVASTYQSDQSFSLTDKGGVFRGTMQSQFGQTPVSGYVMDGTCTFMVGTRARYVGACDSKRFEGQQHSGGKVASTFAYAGSATAPQYAGSAPAPQVTTPTRPLTTQQPELSGRYAALPRPRIELPATGFGYFEGDDAEEQPSDSGSAGSARAPAGLQAPAGTVWNYGRNRWVVTPSGNCAPQVQLVKGYCFGAVIGYLQRNPKVRNVVAVALTQGAPVGTWISNDTPIRYIYVEVSRRGEGFVGQKHLTGTNKVPIPTGCHFAPLKDGFLVTGFGAQGLQEASLFRCP